MSLPQARPADWVDVLIAEEDAPTRRHLRDVLEQEGYHCAEAGSGPEAVEQAERHAPKCVLLDLVPPQDELRVAHRLRSRARTQAAFIHCLTWPDAERDPPGKTVDASALLRVVRQDLGSPLEWAHGLSKADADDLVDWLENHGVQGQVHCEEGQGFAVRCPGFQVEKDLGAQVLRIRRQSRHQTAKEPRAE
jgi:CheY-like chemotaxis protein